MSDQADEQPHDLYAERYVLANMLQYENAIPDVLRVLGEQPGEVDHAFYRPAHWMIYRAILAVWDRGQTPDVPLVVAELTKRRELNRVGGPTTISDLFGLSVVVANVGIHAEAIAEKYQLREDGNLAVRLQQALTAEDCSHDRVRTLVEEWQSRQAERSSAAAPWAGQLVAGGGFVLDAPVSPRAIWGDGDQVAWADGESLLIAGPPGVGKTTITVQLVKARLGLAKEVLGLPVQPGERNVLYLAMDRPPQIARAMSRVFSDEHRDVLDERLVMWKGPPPADFARNTSLLAEMCAQAGADTVIVDSLKDAVLKLSDDESGSGYNRARQRALVEGVQVIELHHQRKANGDNKKPSKLDDVYGSTWLTAGAGSVALLWGQAGDPVVELLHLKQPMEPIGPFQIMHDHQDGTSSIYHQTDLLLLVEQQRHLGLTAQVAAKALFSTEKPTPSEVAKARRKLDRYVTDGMLYLRPGAHGGSTDRNPAAYFLYAREET